MGRKSISTVRPEGKSKNDIAGIKVFEQDDKLWTTSLEVAEKFGKRHDTVLRAVRNLECSDEFRRRNFAEADYADEQGKPRPMVAMSRGGFSMVVMGFTGRDAVAWKEKFIAAFDLMENTIIEQAKRLKRQGELDWQTQRQEGKRIRRIETDAIKDFVEYAQNQGSKNAKFYYSTVTTMAYRALFLLDKGLEKHFPGKLREHLDIRQTINLSAAELAVEQALRDGMKQDMPYKEIFLFAKNRVEMLASIMGKTFVLPPTHQPQLSLR